MERFEGLKRMESMRIKWKEPGENGRSQGKIEGMRREWKEPGENEMT